MTLRRPWILVVAAIGGGLLHDPISRGQMAVFLSKALGLHWPL
jgi:hypothetical protein